MRAIVLAVVAVVALALSACAPYGYDVGYYGSYPDYYGYGYYGTYGPYYGFYGGPVFIGHGHERFEHERFEHGHAAAVAAPPHTMGRAAPAPMGRAPMGGGYHGGGHR
jgi:hypothetical protein